MNIILLSAKGFTLTIALIPKYFVTGVVMLYAAQITFYRLFSGIVVMLPLIITFVIEGGPVASFIYAPLASLLALFVAMFFDEKLVKSLSQVKSTELSVGDFKLRRIRSNPPQKTRESCCLLN